MAKWLTPNLLQLTKIGSGGMADVYRGTLFGGRGFQRAVAIKIIRVQASIGSSVRQLIEHEVNLLSKLSHPNIAQAFGCEETPDGLALIMELVEGHTIDAIFSKARDNKVALDESFIGYIGLEVSKALAFAHGLRSLEGNPLNIIHRDVSPQNVMIDRHGLIKVLDFGVAKSVDNTAVTKTGTFVGKLGYLAPEYVSRGELTQSFDQFSLGVILFELLTGKRLFMGEDFIRLVGEISQFESNAVREELSRHSEKLAPIICTMLENNASNRFDSMGEVLVCFEEALTQIDPRYSAADAVKALDLIFTTSLTSPTQRKIISSNFNLEPSAASQKFQWWMRRFFRSDKVIAASEKAKLAVLLVLIFFSVLLWFGKNTKPVPPNTLGMILQLKPMARFTAETALTDKDGRVSRWQDQRGPEIVLVQADPQRQPVLISNAGQQWLRFDGNDDFLLANNLSNYFKPVKDATIVLKFREDPYVGTTDTHSLLALQAKDLDGDVLRFGTWNSKLFLRIRPQPSEEFLLSEFLAFGSPAVATISADQRNVRMFVNNVPVTVSERPPQLKFVTANILSLGQEFDNGAPTDFFRGEISDLLWFDRSLSDTERYKLQKWLLNE